MLISCWYGKSVVNLGIRDVSLMGPSNSPDYNKSAKTEYVLLFVCLLACS